MKYAIIATGGKQYRVAEGASVQIEKLPEPVGTEVTFPKVLLYADGKQTIVGTPYIKKATVTGSVAETFKDDKVMVVKFKSKVRYRRQRGHRQFQSAVKIKKISATG